MGGSSCQGREPGGFSCPARLWRSPLGAGIRARFVCRLNVNTGTAVNPLFLSMRELSRSPSVVGAHGVFSSKFLVPGFTALRCISARPRCRRGRALSNVTPAARRRRGGIVGHGPHLQCDQVPRHPISPPPLAGGHQRAQRLVLGFHDRPGEAGPWATSATLTRRCGSLAGQPNAGGRRRRRCVMPVTTKRPGAWNSWPLTAVPGGAGACAADRLPDLPAIARRIQANPPKVRARRHLARHNSSAPSPATNDRSP